MRQHVNLLGPAFRRQRRQLTLGRTAAAAVAVALLLTVVRFYGAEQTAGLREEIASAQTLLKAQTAHIARLKGDGAAAKGASGLDGELQRLEAELKSARETVNVLEGGGFGNRGGFAGYLQAFSRQAIDGLWLTGFTIGGTGEVIIEGRTVAPELVPSYIQRLNKEAVLQGREFAALEMRRPQADAAPGVDAKAGARAAPARYLEFALSTAIAADSSEAKK